MTATFTIQDIEQNCRDLAELRGKLRRKYEARQKAMNAIAAEHDAQIRNLQIECDHTRATLLAGLAEGRELFLKRKTQVFHGITVGFVKDRDKVIAPDEAILVQRIEKMLPAAQAETLLDRSVRVIKDAFTHLPADLFQKLGCSVVTGADRPVVRANDDDIESLVQKSIGEAMSAS
jgi:hypothetical protein